MASPELNNPELIDSILDEALRCVRDRRSFDIDQVCERYPELADDLRLMLPAITVLERPASEVSRSDTSLSHARESLPAKIAGFQILSEIGRGSMGIVYKAIQPSLERQVALKVLFRGHSAISTTARFQREAEIVGRLHHGNIIPVFEAGESDGIDYFAMQYIDGTNLQQLIACQRLPKVEESTREQTNLDRPSSETVPKHDPTLDDGQPKKLPTLSLASSNVLSLSAKTCANIAVQVADGLQFAHENDVLHRDIKPSNIILDGEGRAWIADFGLAKSNDDGELTATGDVIGTVRYLAPERFRGQADPRSDVYSLGLTLYEMLMQRPLCPTNDRAQMVKQIVSGAGLRVREGTSHIHEDLLRIIEKAVAFEPTNRYQSAKEMAEDLRRYLDGRPIMARKQSVFRLMRFWAKRNPLSAFLTATTIFALGMGTVGSIVLASYWRLASYREQLQGIAASQSAESAIAESKKSKELHKLSANVLSRMTSKVIQDALASSKSPTDEQGEFLKSVLEYNRQLLDLSGEDMQSRSRIATALRETSCIQDLLGNRKQALSDISESIAILRVLASESPQSEIYTTLADSLLEQGKLFASSGVLVDALKCNTEALDNLMMIPPDEKDTRILGIQGTVENNIANIHQQWGDFPQAIGWYEKAIQLQSSLVDQSPDNEERQQELARSISNLSLTLMKSGELDRATESAKKTIEIRERLCLASTTNHAYQFDLANIQMIFGRIELAKDDNEAAERWFKESQTITKKLVIDYPSVSKYGQLLASCLRYLASVKDKKGQSDEALRLRFEYVAAKQQIVDAAPDLTSNRLALVFCQFEIAEELETSHPDDALRLAIAGADECRKLLQTEAEDKIYGEYLVRLTHLQGAILSRSGKQLDEAIQRLDEARNLLSALADKHVNEPSWVILRARIWNGLGVTHNKLSKFADSLPWFDQSIDLLLGFEPNTEFLQQTRNRLLSDAYYGRATSHEFQKNYAEAQPDWEQVISMDPSPGRRLHSRLSLAFGHARSVQNELALERVRQINDDATLTTTQHRRLARIFVILAANEVDAAQRQNLLDSAKNQLLIAYRGDAKAVAGLESDPDFKVWWKDVSP